MYINRNLWLHRVWLYSNFEFRNLSVFEEPDKSYRWHQYHPYIRGTGLTPKHDVFVSLKRLYNDLILENARVFLDVFKLLLIIVRLKYPVAIASLNK